MEVHAQRAKARRWSNAYALGTDRGGKLIWGGAYAWDRLIDARDSAVQYCAKEVGETCKVVMINGDFKVSDFIDFAKTLSPQSITDVRRAFLKSIASYTEDINAGWAGSARGSVYAYAYTSNRE